VPELGSVSRTTTLGQSALLKTGQRAGVARAPATACSGALHVPPHPDRIRELLSPSTVVRRLHTGKTALVGGEERAEEADVLHRKRT
jgi:hypothetical protein